MIHSTSWSVTCRHLPTALCQTNECTTFKTTLHCGDTCYCITEYDNSTITTPIKGHFFFCEGIREIKIPSIVSMNRRLYLALCCFFVMKPNRAALLSCGLTSLHTDYLWCLQFEQLSDLPIHASISIVTDRRPSFGHRSDLAGQSYS